MSPQLMINAHVSLQIHTQTHTHTHTHTHTQIYTHTHTHTHTPTHTHTTGLHDPITVSAVSVTPASDCFLSAMDSPDVSRAEITFRKMEMDWILCIAQARAELR